VNGKDIIHDVVIQKDGNAVFIVIWVSNESEIYISLNEEGSKIKIPTECGAPKLKET
jgi:hypothetical protein